MAEQAEDAKKKAGRKPKGIGSPNTPPQDRPPIIERICELYESQHSTIASCCEANGISDRVFHLWLAQNSDFSERYAKAKKKADNFWFEEILRPKAMRASEMLLEEKTVEEIVITDLTFQGYLTKQKKKTVTTSVRQPNATIAIFAMKGAFPEKFVESDTPTHINVTFTDDAKQELNAPGEAEETTE